MHLFAGFVLIAFEAFMFRSTALALAAGLAGEAAYGQTDPVPQAVSELIERWVAEEPIAGNRLRPQRVECAGSDTVTDCVLVYGPGATVTVTLVGDRTRTISADINATTPLEAARAALHAALAAHQIDGEARPDLMQSLLGGLRRADSPQTGRRFTFGWGFEGRFRRRNSSEGLVKVQISCSRSGCRVTFGDKADAPT